jgi:hypothetical protein
MRTRIVTLGLLAATALGAAPAADAAQAPANARLTAAVNRYSRHLGYKRDHGPAIRRAALPSDVAYRLADELNQLYRCDLITRSALPALLQRFPAGFPEGTPPVMPTTQRAGDTTLGFPVPAAPNPELPENFPFQHAVQKCGEASVGKLDRVQAALTGRALPQSASLDLWPVLRLAPGDGHHTYTNDYVLLVEMGGHNTFLNNAGGSGMDIWRGPAGSAAKLHGPAHGCVAAFDIVRKQLCNLGSAALLELGGDNQYGSLDAPDPATDAACTNDPVQRRSFVQGAGVAAVGILIDAGSNNTYYGKTLTTGVGHIGGYGYLRAEGDHNRYSIIRSGLGSSVVGGIGVFIAQGDDNTYGYYDPAPKDPNAQPGALGSGGIVNDLNGCDNGTSILLGSGAVGGVGVFQAHGTGNSYTAPVNSLGSGTVGGKGTFISDGGGADTYAGPGAAGRADNTTVAPTSTNNGTFVDR